MINVYFVQHGVSQPKEIDEKRPLSEIGRDETQRVANKLKQQGITLNKIYHSGKLRAVQTAELFANIMGVTNISELEGMKPNDDANDFLQQITENAVMYIGHLPHIHKVVSALICGDENCMPIQFQNSAVICIEIDQFQASAKWFINPEMC